MSSADDPSIRAATEPSGYLSDITYPDRFHRELSPAWLNYAAVMGGAPPRRLDRPFTYLDLGCGFAHSTVVNAGAFPDAEFHACDFNPAHVDAATRHASRLGVENIRFHQTYFDELLRRDLPAFDFIILHGIYSWVGADVRSVITQIISQKLKPDGLAYVSYNCLPGWAADSPLRRLMLELATRENGGTEQRATAALQELGRLSQANFKYFRDNAAAITTVDELRRNPAEYLAHEFLNPTWTLYYSLDVVDELARAGATHAGSATLTDNHPALLIDAKAAEAIARLRSPRLQQLALDFAVNQRFRRDVFVRGTPPLPGTPEALKNIDDLIVGCVGELEQITNQIIVPRGKMTFQDSFVGELRRILGAGALPLGQIASALGGDGRNGAAIRQNLLFLVAAGTLMPFARAGVRPDAPRAGSILKSALQHILDTNKPAVVPCEQLGNGVLVAPNEAARALAWLSGSGGDADAPLRLIRLGLLSATAAAAHAPPGEAHSAPTTSSSSKSK